MANNPEINYHLFKILESSPGSSQRQMAGEVGFSLGKFNYCLKALIRKGFVKVERFTSSDHKAGYMYILTPHGIEEKSRITVKFLQRKMKEFDEIKEQIEELQREVGQDGN